MKIKYSLLVSAGLLCFVAMLVAQSPDLQQRVGAMKQSFQQSQQRLRSYEWIETTTFSLKGDVKSQKQNRCYYGADGKLQKVPLSATPAPQKKRGLRGKIAENKKEELSDYMAQAVNLVKLYVPPIADQIQQSVRSNNASIHVMDGGARAAVEFRSYVQPGDSLTITIDIRSNQVLSASVLSYLGNPEDAVNLNVQFGTLNDGTIYASDVKLNAPNKKVEVMIQNTGYKPM